LISKDNTDTHVFWVAESNGHALNNAIIESIVLTDMGKTKMATKTGSSYNLS